MNREAMPRKKDMEAVKAESPTLVPSMEDAETVLSTEAETVMKDDSETVKAEGFEAAGQDGDTVNAREVPGMDASVVGTPENPINLDTGEVYDEEDEVTEKINMKAREAREVDHEADTVQLEQASEEAVMEAGEDTVLREPSVLDSVDAFNAMTARAEEVGMAELAGISHAQYSEMATRQAEVQKELDSAGFFKKMFGSGSLKAEISQISNRMDAFDRLAEQIVLKDQSDANPAEGSGLGGTDRSRARAAKSAKAGKAGFGR